MIIADLVLRGGPVFTGDGWARAVAIQGERVVAVETDEGRIDAWVGPTTRVVSLKGRCAVPGFHDAHTHLLGGALAAQALDVTHVRSRRELAEAVRDWIAAKGEDAWVVGRGWEADQFEDKGLPTRGDLDAVAPRTPVALRRRDGHASVVSSRALELAGITRDTPDPPGGRIQRGPDGEPTGILLEDPAIELVGSLVPPASREAKERALRPVLQRAASLGITSIQDDPSYDDSLHPGELYSDLYAQGDLPVRITIWRKLGRAFDALQAEERALAERGIPAHHVRYGLLKGYLDGSLGSRTALLFEPYLDDPSAGTGVDLDEAGLLLGQVADAHRAGYQVGLHAIGDLAAARALDAFAAAAGDDLTTLVARRHRIEHAEHFRPEDIPRLAELGVVASMQPIHLAGDMLVAPTALGPERCKTVFPWRSVLSAGAPLAFGTDFPVEVLDPGLGLFCALTRRSPRHPERSAFVPEEAIGLEVALAAYTVGAAWSNHQETELGRLAPGFLADVAVLSGDLTTLPVDELPAIRCDLTVRGGEVVFERG